MNSNQRGPDDDRRSDSDDRAYRRDAHQGYQRPPSRVDRPANYSVGLPLFLIITGSLWLLYIANMLPTARQSIGYGLVGLGVVLFVIMGFNKRSVVVAPLVMYVGGAVLAWDYLRRVDVLVAAGMILYGALMLIAFSDWIPETSTPLGARNDSGGGHRGGGRDSGEDH